MIAWAQSLLPELLPLAEIGSRSLRFSLLLFGGITLMGGLMAMFTHQQTWAIAREKIRDSKVLLFEQRKYRRRMTTSSMIAAIGVALGALYWAQDPRAFTALILLILAMLLGVLGMAMLDMMSVGLQSFNERDDESRQEMIREYLKLREKIAKEKDAEG